jgi:DNA-binding CsgD family transcriptional regulator
MRLGEQNSAALGRTALETARAIGARSQEASALITIGLAIAYLEDPAGGEDALREGLRLAVNIPDHEMALRGYVNLSDVLESRGQHREAVEAAREGLALAARVGLSRSLGSYLSGNLAESLVRLGEWTEARRLAAESTRFGLTGIFSATWHELVGYMAVLSGQHEEALAHVRAAVRELGTNQEPQFLQSLAYLESEAARARGDDEQAAAVVRRALEGNTPGWSARYAWPLVWQAERIAADRAWRARDRNEPPPSDDVDADPGMTPDLGTVAPSTIAYRALAAAEGARRALADPVPAWREAVEAWQRAGDAWPLAYARYRLAEALLARGDRDEAAGLLPMTVAVAEQLGAHPLRDDALALARRARVPLGEITRADEPSTADTAPFRLTEREREVLALVAAGRSNGQIATELFISPKTASVHVSNILAKLGVGGRVEAAGVAHRLGLIPPA